MWFFLACLWSSTLGRGVATAVPTTAVPATVPATTAKGDDIALAVMLRNLAGVLVPTHPPTVPFIIHVIPWQTGVQIPDPLAYTTKISPAANENSVFLVITTVLYLRSRDNIVILGI